MLRWHPAAKNEGFLQRLGEGDKAFAAMDHLHVTPARKRQAEVEQTVLQHRPSHGDRHALEQREIGDPKHPGPVLLQEHHLLGRPVQGPPLLDAELDRPLTAKPLLARPDLLEMEQQGLGFQLRCLLEQPLRGTLRLRHQDAVPDLSQGISTGTPVPAPPLLLPLGLQLTLIDPLGAAHRDAH